MNLGSSRRKLARCLGKRAGEPEAVAGSEYRGPGGDLRLPLAAKPEADIVEFRACELAPKPPATSTLPLGSNVAV